MPPKTEVLVLAGISVAVGIAVLVTSSLIIDDFRPALNLCEALTSGSFLSNSLLTSSTTSSSSGACEPLKYWIAAGSFGIIASLIQILSFGVAWTEKIKVWCGLHIFVAVLALTGFSIAVDKNGFDKNATDKAKAFTILCGIDTLFAFIFVIAMYKMSMK